MMSVSSTGSVTDPTRADRKQIRSDFAALRSDLSSGNLAGAQSDFATLLKDAPNLQAQLTNSTSAAGSATAASPRASVLSQLSSALQSGDLTGAQSALTSLRQLSGAGHHHHHHHHHGGGGSSPLADLTGTSGTDSSSAAGNVSRQAIRADFQTLAADLQSGDLASAQTAWTQLQKDAPWLSGGNVAGTTPTTGATG